MLKYDHTVSIVQVGKYKVDSQIIPAFSVRVGMWSCIADNFNTSFPICVLLTILSVQLTYYIED
jgi:hypothetical protein